MWYDEDGPLKRGKAVIAFIDHCKVMTKEINGLHEHIVKNSLYLRYNPSEADHLSQFATGLTKKTAGKYIIDSTIQDYLDGKDKLPRDIDHRAPIEDGIVFIRGMQKNAAEMATLFSDQGITVLSNELKNAEISLIDAALSLPDLARTASFTNLACQQLESAGQVLHEVSTLMAEMYKSDDGLRLAASAYMEAVNDEAQKEALESEQSRRDKRNRELAKARAEGEYAWVDNSPVVKYPRPQRSRE